MGCKVSKQQIHQITTTVAGYVLIVNNHDSDNFGPSVALNNEFVVVGSSEDDTAGTDAGMVSIYHYDNYVQQWNLLHLRFVTIFYNMIILLVFAFDIMDRKC